MSELATHDRERQLVAQGEATFQQAVMWRRRGAVAKADSLCAALIRSDPCHHRAWHLRGLIAIDLGHLCDGIELIRRCLSIDCNQPAAHSNIGNALLTLKQPQQALTHFETAVRLKPDFAAALYNRGNALLALNRPEQALASYDQALAINPQNLLARQNRAVALSQLNRPAQALAAFEDILRIDSGSLPARQGRASALLALARAEESLAECDHLLRGAPSNADSHCCRGNALLALQRFDEAIECFSSALHLDATHNNARVNRADAFKALGRLDEALQELRMLSQMASPSALVLSNLGGLLLEMYRFEEALATIDQALAVEPDHADAHSNRAAALLLLHRPQAALEALDKAMRAGATSRKTFTARAQALKELGRHDEALSALEQLCELHHGQDYTIGQAFDARLACCQWTGFAQTSTEIINAVRTGAKVMHPFAFLRVSDSAQAQLQCAQTFASDVAPPAGPPLCGAGYGHRRIRIAYVSPDLRDHAVSYLLAGVFEKHDSSRFETTAISLRSQAESAFARRLRSAFVRFIDASGNSDREVASLIRELEIDIAVNLMGYTDLARAAIFSMRPAPVQVNYLGFPATCGSNDMDYIIGDQFVIPAAAAAHYSEQVVYLPECFQPNDDRRTVGAALARADLGLPDGVVLCCFNDSSKINPAMFDIWCRVLAASADSVLWLIGDSEPVRANLRQEAARRGVDPRRLIMARRAPYESHLRRMQAADLFLDTLPFNGGASASDALWAGVPVLTCAGEAFASRMAGSLLRAMGLPELVTFSLEDYEALAIKLVRSPRRLAEYRRSVIASRSTAPLFNTPRSCRHLEAAYTMMWQRAERGEPPASFKIDPI